MTPREIIFGIVIVIALASINTASNIVGKNLSVSVPVLFMVYFNVCFDVLAFALVFGNRLCHKQATKRRLSNSPTDNASINGDGNDKQKRVSDVEVTPLLSRSESSSDTASEIIFTKETTSHTNAPNPEIAGVNENNSPMHKISRARTIWVALFMTVIYQSGNVTYFLGLDSLPLTQSLIIYQCTTGFVFVFSLLLLKEEVHPFKVAAVVLSIVGASAASIQPSDDSSHNTTTNATGDEATPLLPPALGTLCLIASAALWALYEVMVPVLLPDATIPDVNRFIGWRGVWNMVLFWPFPLAQALWPGNESIFDGLVEDGSFHSNAVIGLILMALMSIGLSILIVTGITCTSPTFIRIGNPLQLILTLIYSYICGNSGSLCELPIRVHPQSWYIILGNSLCVLGFILVLIPWNYEKYKCTIDAPLLKMIKGFIGDRCNKRGEEDINDT